jgi:hypothetical protein
MLTNIKHLLMKRNEKYTSNECVAYKSLPNILFSSKSNKILQLHMSKSLPSCLKFVEEQSQYDKRVSISNRMNIENITKKKSNPTIGELLGDDELFHYQYHNQYSSSRSKRKQQHHHHHHLSYSRSSYINVHYGRRKQRRSNYYFSTIQESQPSLSSSELIESIANTNQVYLYPTTYNYTPIPTYCYYCYSNTTSCCPCLTSDCYGGLYQQEIYYET